jgi:hypothetical protein
MIFLPWIVFFLGISYMIWQGTKAKKEYLRRKSEQERLPGPNVSPHAD